MAKTLKKKFDAQFKNANSNFEKALVEYRANIDNCSICGSSKESFEPPVYYCNGRCGSNGTQCTIPTTTTRTTGNASSRPCSD